MTTSKLHAKQTAVIRYLIGNCALGHILVAHSGRGIAAVLPGDNRAGLLHELRQRFAGTAVQEDAGLHVTLAAVIAVVEKPTTRCSVPLDLRGTVFQQKVWRALQHIPAGKTLGYADVARKIDMPGAARAVAGACAANPCAIVVPCHRVVRSNGELSGYRWGVELKRRLLEREMGVSP